ncbi:MAG: AAA family ATPase [Chloroflexi bacterium]|nr:AAA family ATPase [Chloroflexota bacterium]
MTDSYTTDAGPQAQTSPSADLMIDEVHVSDFRNIVDIRIPLQSGATFLVGENNAGKSSSLLAIATACGFHRATRDDLHQSDEGTSTEATIDLIIRSVGKEFVEAVAQRLNGNFSNGPGPGEWTAIRTRLVESRESSFLSTRRSYLSWDASTQTWIATTRAPSSQVLELLAAHLVDAFRDLSVDVLSRTSDWGRVLADLGVSEADRKTLEESLSDLGHSLQDASPTFRKLASELVKMKDSQSDVEEVQLRPLPGRLEDLARSVDIVVGAGSGRPALPMRLQGLGSRSLAALRVFRALCELRVGVDQGVRPQLITLLEEPEAHLHPQAQAAMYRFIQDLPGQVVVATHSSVLIGETDLEAVRILRSTKEGTTVHKLGSDTAKKLAVFRRYISRPLGELFFARMVVLVDGAAERITLPELLGPLLGRDIAGLGLTILDMESPSREWVKKVVEGLDALGGIPWIAFVDNDSDGLHAIDGCIGSDGTPLSTSHSQVVVSGNKQLEQLLLDAGYGPEIEMVANKYSPRLSPDPASDQPRLAPYGPSMDAMYLAFLKKSKGWAGELIAREAMRNGKAAPAVVIDLASRIRATLNLVEPVTESYRAASGGV